MRPDLPSGTVTFLFTDVEGSTKLLEEIGDEAYAHVLSEHHRLCREAWQQHRGIEVDTEGDAFFVVFERASDALAAAAAAQEALAAGPVRVRMGLHTGGVLLTETGYVGRELHLAARIASAGHGDQVVLSKETSEQAGEGFAFSDLGEHRFKDFEAPISIFQLGYGSFPPLKTISNTNLPRPASSFVGREEELQEVLSRIEAGARLVTLTGPGGSGKTRLALEAAATLVPSYKAGVFWVGLASLRDPALVSETISQTLGAKDGLAEHIAERELLLLLDNLEQVIEAAPELSELLEACPNLTLLVTSRELLRVQGEVEYPVPPLASPEAVSLFCERAQTEPSEDIRELCARLDNLPLAVELAAARVKALSPAQILERLAQRLDLLKGGRDADPRQQTLRATIEWSYDLLSEAEQRLFARLSVFSGGCTLEAAEEVCDADLDLLQSLVEKSLLRFTTSDTGSRYWMLGTIREYAGEKLDESGELEESKQRHADFVLTLASQLEVTFGSDPKLQERFAMERANFREALAWAEQAIHADSQLDLIGATWPFWANRGNFSEGLRWVESALTRCEGEWSGRRAKVLVAGAAFAMRLGDLETTKRYADASLQIFRDLVDPTGVTCALIFLGVSAEELGEHGQAADLFEEAIAVARPSGNRVLAGIGIANLGDIALRQGDYARAIPLFEEALGISRELENDGVAQDLYNLAFSLYCAGRSEEGVSAAKESLALAHEIEGVLPLVFGFVFLASVANHQGNHQVGAKLLGAAEILRERIGLDVTGAEGVLLGKTHAALRDVLGEERYATALAEGRALSVGDAVEYAFASID